MQAHPEPEVGRVGLQLALHVHDVRRHQQQPAVRLAERVELPQDPRGEETEQRADLGAGDPRTDGLGDGAGRTLLPSQLRGHRVDDLGETVGVGLHPGRAVDDQDRRGVGWGVEPGEVADVPRRTDRALAKLGHGLHGLLGLDPRPVAGDLRTQLDRQAPVDHLREFTAHAGNPTW